MASVVKCDILLKLPCVQLPFDQVKAISWWIQINLCLWMSVRLLAMWRRELQLLFFFSFFFGGGVFLILVPVDCGLMEHIHFFLWHPVYQLKALSMDVVVCFCNLSIVRLRQEDHQYFEVNLGYKLSIRPDWSSVRHCLKMKNIIIRAILAKLCCYTSFLFTLLTLLVV